MGNNYLRPTTFISSLLAPYSYSTALSREKFLFESYNLNVTTLPHSKLLGTPKTQIPMASQYPCCELKIVTTTK